METQTFSHHENQYDATMMPNGLILISSDDLRIGKGRKRNYRVFIAGGRLADIDPPGAGLAFVRTLPAHLNSEFGGKLNDKAVTCSMEHGYIELNYTHHGKDRHDAKCLETLIRMMMNNPPSAKLFSASRGNGVAFKNDVAGAFWSWFYSKVSPDWHRMCITPWDESEFAKRAERKQSLRFRDKFIHPANTLVFSGEPCLHEDLVERLSQLNVVNASAQRFVCKAPSVTALYEDCPFDDSIGKKQDLLIFYPLPKDRQTYIKIVIAFYALFGEKGFLEKFLKKQRLVLRPELHTVFWPQPFAFIKLSTTSANFDRTLELVRIAQSYFADLPTDKQLELALKAARNVVQKFAVPVDILRDELLTSDKVDFSKDVLKMSLKGLSYLIRVYLSESRMGVISGLPGTPKGRSIFDAI
ncbi:MAG: hypothetical protein P1P90_01950 [Patescibacteria group bacterium]|nr:hypothetical protein [Patescibacteria group bacterium]